MPEQIEQWRLQTRVRKRESIEFINVSLDKDQQTPVQVVNFLEAPPGAWSAPATAVAPNGVTFAAPQPANAMPAPVPTVPGMAPPAAPDGAAVIMPAPAPQATGNLSLSYAPVPVDQTELMKQGDEQMKRREELHKTLADKHGYKLEKNQPLRYIPESSIAARDSLASRSPAILSVEEWMSQPQGEQPEGETYEPFMLIFQQQPDGSLHKSRQTFGIITLAEVLYQVLDLKRQEFECPAGLLMTYMPGDWILSWDPQQPHEWTDADLAAFEKILNEQLNLNVKVGWKTIKKPALVIRGKYQANPQSEENVINSPDADGSFGLLARRSYLAGTGGSYEDFKLAIGEALMLPVVDEAQVRPKKKTLFWFQSGEPVTNSDRLPPEQEQIVIKSLHAQLGYDFKIEPRKVKVLSIKSLED